MNSIDRQIESIMHSYAVGPRSGYRQNQKTAFRSGRHSRDWEHQKYHHDDRSITVISDLCVGCDNVCGESARELLTPTLHRPKVHVTKARSRSPESKGSRSDSFGRDGRFAADYQNRSSSPHREMVVGRRDRKDRSSNKGSRADGWSNRGESF